jgi:ABC-type hemin transport system ATPase subunit
MAPALECRDVSYHRSGRVLVQRVSLYAARGEVLVCAGDPGSGADTLVALLAGAAVPDAGRILVDGRIRRPRTPAAGRDPRVLATGPAAAAALLAEPGDASILLLARPFAPCATDRSHDLLAAARRRAGTGRAVLLTTDDLATAAPYADSVVVLAAGRLVAWGAPDVVLAPALRVLDRGTAGRRA